jgi:CheY-like chemotaxis protein
MKRMRVLFVDDEPGARLTMPEVLRQHGFSVTPVAAVDEALHEITSAQLTFRSKPAQQPKTGVTLPLEPGTHLRRT